MAQSIEFIARIENGAVVWASSDGTPAKNHKVTIGQGANPEKIKIVINSDESAKDLKLRVDHRDPFQVHEDGTRCPPSGIHTDQIELLPGGSDHVTVRSRNTGAPRTLRYQVNVVDKNGNPHPCDPIIENNGGGPGIAVD